MDLKTFIASTLAQIVEGVVEAQKTATEHGAYVNPAGLLRASNATTHGERALWDSSNNFAQLVSFDVALTVEEGAQTGARIGVLSGVFNAGARGESSSREIAATRLQFSVPVLLPASDASGRVGNHL